MVRYSQQFFSCFLYLLIALSLTGQIRAEEPSFDELGESFFGFEDAKKHSEEVGELEQKIAEYQSVLDELIQRDSPRFYDLNGSCLDFSAPLLQELQSSGYPVQLAQTAPSEKSIYISGKDEKQVLTDKRHFFLVDRSLGEDQEIIIDPTIMQFFHKTASRVEVRKIFVGTKGSLFSFFGKNQKYARLIVPDFDNQVLDENQGHYAPGDLVCVIYSVDRCSQLRTNF